MSIQVDDLIIDIQSKSKDAVNGVDALSASLNKLKSTVNGGLGLTSLTNNLSNLNKSLDSVSANSTQGLVTAVNTLKSLNGVKISSSIGNQLNKISSAMSGLNNVSFSGITNLNNGLKSIDYQGNSGLTSTINALNKLPNVASKLKEMDLQEFGRQIDELANKLEPLNKALYNVGTTFDRLPSKVRQLANVTDRATRSNRKLSFTYTELLSKARLFIGGISGMAHIIGRCINESNKYVEDLNLFNASMGEYTTEARKYADTVSEAMGIDPAEWMRNQGIFQTMAEGFGVASDRAYIMSKNLTQLGYDLSSFYNISYQDAMLKLQSGLAGELEPLRRLGYDLSQARLQAEALSLGIDKNFNSMTQAEKAQIRYYAIMTQVTTAQGDMARTLNAPANQLRILSAQVRMAARSIGNIFIPILNLALPYLIAFAKVVRMVADVIAKFFGFKLPEVDYSGLQRSAVKTGDIADNVGDIGGGLGKAAKNAKKLKNNLLGIDELNIISPDTAEALGGGGSGGGGIGGGGAFDSGLDFELPEYDFLSDIVSTKTDDIVKKIKETWKEILLLASTSVLAIGTILALSGVNVPLGIGLIAVGALGIAASVALNWGAMFKDIKKTISNIMVIMGAAGLVIGGILAFTGVNMPLGIGLMLAGATSLGAGVGLNWDSIPRKIKTIVTKVLVVLSTATLTLGSLLAFTGANIPLGIGLIAVGAASMAGAISMNWNKIVQEIKRVVTNVLDILGKAMLVLGVLLVCSGVGIGVGLGLILGGLGSLTVSGTADWGAVGKKVKTALNGIGDLFDKFLDKIKDIGSSIKEYALEWGSKFLDGFVSGLGDIATWIYDHLVAPIVDVIKNNPIPDIVVGIKNTVSEWWTKVKTWWKEKSKEKLTVEALVGLLRNKWDTVTSWISNSFMGKLLNKGIGLIREGWDFVTEWIKNSYMGRALSKGIGVVRTGWQYISNWIKNSYMGDAVNKGIGIVRNAWDTVTNWIKRNFLGGGVINIAIDIVKGWAGSATKRIKKWLGLANGGVVTPEGIKMYKNGGIIPHYAGGTTRANHGSLFVAGESGAEMVAHINGRTEVMNRFQIASVMKEAVVSGMMVFGNYFRGVNNKLAECTNAMITAMSYNSTILSNNLDKEPTYYDIPTVSNSVDNTTRSFEPDNANMSRIITEFYINHVEPTLKQIAEDTKRQADKKEEVNVQVGNRVVTESVDIQKRANGFVFTN